MKRDIEVMVVDDEPVVCERLRDYLEKKEVAVETFTESQEAIDRLREKEFDVIVTDLKMKGPTGMDVLLSVKRLGYKSKVIMITGYGTFETMRDAEAADVFEYVSKPFKMADMHGLIKKAAKGARKQSR
jgi:DNA-binding NtrC family response regulator